MIPTAAEAAEIMTRLERDHTTAEIEVGRRSLVSTRFDGVSENLEVPDMCRNIKLLFNFNPPVTEERFARASLQFVRKVTGFNKPSKANEAAFLAAVDGIAAISRDLLHSLETSAPPRNREEVAAKARERAAERFSR